MNFFQYFEKLHITVKSAVLTILGQIPFFFVSIYLFKHDLINLVGAYPLTDMDFLFIIGLCFCLSITWYAMNLILSLIACIYVDDILNQPTTDFGDVFNLGTIYSLGYLSIAILINFKCKISFFWFLIFAYGFIVIRLVWIGIVWFYYTYKRKKKVKNNPH